MVRNFLLALCAVLISVTLVYPQTGQLSGTAESSPTLLKAFTPESRAMWDLELSFNMNTATGAAGNAGAEFDGTYLYSTRWATNLIHKYDMAGNLIEQFSIPGVSGLRDLAFDGTYFYGGAAGNVIYQMDFVSKTLIGTIPSPVAVRFIAYDEGSDAFWCGTWADNPTLVSRSGTAMNTITTGLSAQYGAAYDNVSAGGPYLWMFDQGLGACPGSLMIIQFNIATGTATGVSHDACNDLTDGIAGGLFSTTDFVAGKFSIGGVMQSNSGLDDTYFVYEVADYNPCGYDLASNPNPANGATDVSVNLAQLSWTNPAGAISNDLYFGTTGNMVLVQSGTGSSWNVSPLPLTYFTNYQWQVVEYFDTCNTTASFGFKTEQNPNIVFVTEDFYPQSADYWTGTTDGTNKTDVSEVRGHNTEDGWFMFDISSVPADAVVDSMRFFGYVNYTYFPYWSLTPLPGLNPLTATASELKTAISNNSSTALAYVYSNESSTFTTGPHNYLMGGTCKADFQAGIANGWFAAGMDSRDNSATYYINWDGWNQTNHPYVRVSYHYASNPTNIFTDNFDSYTAGVQLCTQTTDWQTWSNLPGTGEDPYVSNNYSWSPSNTVVIAFNNDLVHIFDTAPITTGTWYASFLAYIPTGKAGYFNTLALFNGSSSDWGMECYFDQGGGGRLLNGGTVNFNWPQATWFQVVVQVDLDNNLAELLLGTAPPLQSIASWQWTQGGTIPQQLDANDFYGATANDEMYVDNYYFGDVMPPIIPVEFTAFTANTSNGNVVLNWTTATETNNRGFEVQRNNGTGFNTIGFVQGNGTTTQIHNYSFTDNAVPEGNYTYRLRQVDFDGTSAYSTVVEVKVVAPRVFSLEQNYPNPFNPETQIKFSLATDSKVTLRVFNILGQEVKTLLNGNMTAGGHSISFNASNLPSGVYIYRIEANGSNGKNFTAVKKMVLTK